MVLRKLVPGMIVYDVRRATGYAALNRKWSTWPVVIKEVDEEKGLVLASWNHNAPEWFRENIWSKWRLKRPAN